MYLLAANKVKDPSDAPIVRLYLDGDYRVPNCALFNKEGNMIAFGLYAQRLYYNNTKRDDLKEVYFFQKFKMQLQHDPVSQFIHVFLNNFSANYCTVLICRMSAEEIK